KDNGLNHLYMLPHRAATGCAGHIPARNSWLALPERPTYAAANSTPRWPYESHVMELTNRLEKCYAAAVHDVLRAMGHSQCVLPHTIKPLDPAKKLAGEIYTVSGYIDQTRDAHDTLVQWTGLLSRAPSGKVMVCQPNTHMVALMGELSAETLQHKGVLGYVVDGGCRDTDFILKLGFPVFCSFNTPADIVGRWVPDRFGEPVTIGTVTVCTGDYLLADR